VLEISIAKGDELIIPDVGFGQGRAQSTGEIPDLVVKPFIWRVVP